jgi:hypothetical protein
MLAGDIREDAMSRRMMRSATCACALLAAVAAVAQEALEERVRKAQSAAKANAATELGRDWAKHNSAAVGRLMIPVLNQCLPQAPDADIPTVFAVYLRLSKTGQVGEVVTELDDTLSKCMTKAAGRMPFPEAPREDYWIQVNMAAPL